MMTHTNLVAAYNLGKQTADKSYTDICYSGDVPEWVFDDTDANEFFEAGRAGYELPTYGTGWRYGAIPESGRSYNYRDDRLERGVSVMQLDGGEKIKTLAELNSLSTRPIVRVSGYVNPSDCGGDGEPLLIACTIARTGAIGGTRIA